MRESPFPPDNLSQQALAALGDLSMPIRAFVLQASGVDWLASAGQAEPWDRDVRRVWSLQAALAAGAQLRPLEDVLWTTLENVGRTVERFDLMRAAEEYWIAEFEAVGERGAPYDQFSPQFDTDMIGAMREIVLDAVLSVTFYREKMAWYRRGHWLCSIDPDGTRVVY